MPAGAFGRDWADVTAASFQFRRIRRDFPSRLGADAAKRGVERLLIRGLGDDGIPCYGEIAPWPGFPTESLAEAEGLLRAAEGDLGRLRASVARSDKPLPCLGSALSMVDTWKASAGFAGALPCAGLLGAHEGPAEAGRLAGQGHACIKAKVAAGGDPERLRAILRATPRETTLRIDANGALGLPEARALVELARAEARVEFVEQPLPPGHPGYAELGHEKVALDESFLGRGAGAPEAAGWRGTLVVKPAMAGDWDGLARLLAGHPADLVVFSSCFETAFGRQASLALAHRLGARRPVGFDTLGRAGGDGWEAHEPGPLARGRADIDWEALWARAS